MTSVSFTDEIEVFTEVQLLLLLWEKALVKWNDQQDLCDDKQKQETEFSELSTVLKFFDFLVDVLSELHGLDFFNVLLTEFHVIHPGLSMVNTNNPLCTFLFLDYITRLSLR